MTGPHLPTPVEAGQPRPVVPEDLRRLMPQTYAALARLEAAIDRFIESPKASASSNLSAVVPPHDQPPIILKGDLP